MMIDRSRGGGDNYFLRFFSQSKTNFFMLKGGRGESEGVFEGKGCTGMGREKVCE